MKAYSYIRFSTPAQAAGDSLKRQTEKAAAFASEQGLELDEELTFEDLGVSALKGKNRTEGALGDFIKAVDSGQVSKGSYLLVESLDRLSREEVFKALNQFMELLEKGITIATLMDGQTYSKERVNKEPFALSLSLSVMQRANEESATKSKRLKAAWDSKRKRAGQEKLTCICPSWLTLSEDRTTFEVDEEKANTVRLIYQLYLDGLGKVSIAKKLNEDGVTPLGKSEGWHSSRIARLLKDPATIGQFQPKRMESIDGKRIDIPDGDPIDGYYPAIIEPDVFFKVQHFRESKPLPKGRRGEAFPNLFRGMAQCGICGGTMHYVNKGKRRPGSQTTNTYLQCSNASRKAGNCNHKTLWPYAPVEYFLTEGIKALDYSPLFPSVMDAAREAIRLLEAKKITTIERIRDIENRKGNLLEEIEVGQAGKGTLGKRIDELETESNDLEQDLSRTEVELNTRQQELITVHQRFDTQDELLDEWRKKQGDPQFRSRLNRIMAGNIESILFQQKGTSEDEIGLVTVKFDGAELDWFADIQHQPGRGHYSAWVVRAWPEDEPYVGDWLYYPPEFRPDDDELHGVTEEDLRGLFIGE